jgi:hypothetical protein
MITTIGSDPSWPVIIYHRLLGHRAFLVLLIPIMGLVPLVWTGSVWLADLNRMRATLTTMLCGPP